MRNIANPSSQSNHGKFLKLKWKKLERLASQVGGARNIFCELFGDHKANNTFWLDSSSIEKVCFLVRDINLSLNFALNPSFNFTVWKLISVVFMAKTYVNIKDSVDLILKFWGFFVCSCVALEFSRYILPLAEISLKFKHGIQWWMGESHVLGDLGKIDIIY